MTGDKLAILRPRWAWLGSFGVRQCYVRIRVIGGQRMASPIIGGTWYPYTITMCCLYRCEMLT